MRRDENWIPVAGSAVGAFLGGIPGAIIGGLLGAMIKELTCPVCKGLMKDEGNYYICRKCSYHVEKNEK